MINHCFHIDNDEVYIDIGYDVVIGKYLKEYYITDTITSVLIRNKIISNNQRERKFESHDRLYPLKPVASS